MDSFCPRCEFAVALESSGSAPPLSPPATELILKRFGDYELLEELGHGGMGVVYKARHLRLDRLVALKLLLLGQFSSEQAVQRFQREAQAAAALRHPNIICLHEVGELDGQPYFTMELVEGRNLASWLRDGPLDPTLAATLCRAIAQAIGAAHTAGIVHRDLKPANILIDPFHQPRITDFGLAKRLDGSGDITLTGHVLGSPNYLAPELAAGREKECGPSSDIFSIGGILYECLTGRPPFLATTLQETLLRIRDSEPVAPRLLNAKLPRDLETICLKCLEKEPAKRYASAELLAADLDRFLADKPIQARPASLPEKLGRWCRRNPVVASLGAATLVLLLAVVIGSPIGLYLITQERQRAERGEIGARQKAYASDMNLAQQAIQANELDRAFQLLDRHRPPTPTPTGGTRSESPSSPGPRGTRPSETDLRGWEWRHLWRQGQGDQRFTLGQNEGRATAVGVLADGTTAFSAGLDNAVRLWNLESRRQIGLLPHPDPVIGAATSPDGRWLAAAMEKEAEGRPILLWDLATQTLADTLITRTPHSTNLWLRPGGITFSPDSQWLAFATVWGGVRLWDVTTRREVTNLPARTPDTGLLGVAFSLDSRILAYNEDDYGAILLWDIISRSQIGRLTGHESFVTSLAFSPDGQTLASSSDDRTARLWNVAERRERSIFTHQSREDGSLAFSPDSSTLALNGAGAGRVIQLVDTATGRRKSELRGHLKRISSLAFTPDGQSLLSASADGTVRVWDVVPHAKEASVHAFPRNFISSDWRSYGPALCLSPDGCHLLTVYTNQTFSLWDTLRLAEGARHRLPFTNTAIAAVAPGGRLVAFSSLQGEVVLWDVERSESRFFAQPGTNQIRRLVFSPDGRRLAGADEFKSPLEMAGSNDDSRRTVRVWEVATGQETHVLSPHGQFLWSLKFSADSQALIAGTWRGEVQLWPLDGPTAVNASPGRAREPSTQPAGTTPITAGFDISIWDTRTRQEIDRFAPEAGWFPGIAPSADGRRLAVGANDGRITIWDVAAHEVVATLHGHQESVTQLAFTPDGNHLVSVSKDQLRVWRAAPPAAMDRRPSEQTK